MIGEDETYFEFDNGDDWNSMDYIRDMKEGSKGIMMDVVYKSVINNELGVLRADTPNIGKIAAIQHILDFFESTEDYEKCLELKKIIDKIK